MGVWQVDHSPSPGLANASRISRVIIAAVLLGRWKALISRLEPTREASRRVGTGGMSAGKDSEDQAMSV